MAKSSNPEQIEIKRKRSDAAFRRERAAHLLAGGMAHKDVAKELDVSPQRISEWLSEPDVAARVKELKRDTIDEAKELLASNAAVAVNTLLESLAASQTKDRISAANSILDRIGVVKGQKIETTSDLANLSDAALATKLREAAEALEGGEE